MKRLPISLSLTAIALCLAPAVRAVVTNKVDHDTFAAFSDGEFDNVSLTSDGHLELAPAITRLAEATDPIIWAAVQDAQGDVFFGTGNQGRVYKLTPKGDLSTFFAPNEVMVHALAIDGKGRLYAATSPNGRVYRLDAGGRAELFCSPGETYVWAMAFGRDGALYLATGNHGKILRVAATEAAPASVETYFETKEANITALAFDTDGSLLAGTSPHGYLYRIDKADHGFVVFNSNRTEIRQIAVAADGTIYASTFAGGSKSETSSNSNPYSVTVSATDGDGAGGSPGENPGDNGPQASRSDSASGGQGSSPQADDGNATILPLGLRSQNAPGGSGSGGTPPGAVYRIDPTGFFTRYWSAPGEEAIYSMILRRDGSLLVGTGEKGRIYSVADASHWRLLQETSDGAQVAALLPDTAEAKQCFAATSHPAKLYRLDFALAESGTYTSKAFDAKQKSLWGRAHPAGDAPAGTKLELSTRSGNTEKPEKTWSDWSEWKPLAAEIPTASPSARFIQYRVQFKRDAASPSATAQLRRMLIYYQNQNGAPVISRIKVHNEGFALSKMPLPQQMEMQGMNLDQLLDGSEAPAPNPALAAMMSRPLLRATHGPGLCTVAWEASDPNQDKLTFSVAIRAESDKQWITLADKTEDTFLSFDTSGFKEGFYFIRVSASDLPSNTPDTALATEAVSEAFLVDNTPPTLTVRKQEVLKDHARIVVEAVDGASIISSAAYSLDGRDEVALRPDGLIFDSSGETFTLELDSLAKGTHSLLLRAQDEAKNTSVLKLSFESQ
jgi:sugar lactone lactonase YvrE